MLWYSIKILISQSWVRKIKLLGLKFMCKCSLFVIFAQEFCGGNSMSPIFNVEQVLSALWAIDKPQSVSKFQFWHSWKRLRKVWRIIWLWDWGGRTKIETSPLKCFSCDKTDNRCWRCDKAIIYLWTATSPHHRFYTKLNIYIQLWFLTDDWA